ncbi:MAG: hypothetical protein COY36_00230 [Zetaproteobacteria bacterium CG_4_10_14_0_2_um_filter_55_20]|nr:MAG: hypothetical protein AUJ58_02380 [Zetaproteobacteria bacterium CG1_02_55_237]PIS19051.1 MAG: hypothetical protein COT53_07690 [Zetaproteobacteria bacterium CG08_land_8_20_14_0_20_55_17]PIY54068.1 MAG: hypothetical protein COZ01_01700 [Zetaproteobacteria bacterium CG_4_10_14_0_8_um_filter_55_43]PIZ40243.1 MAG: hypothetical protein COY36_00230 [Zetaproteobacteria bacterium CG_4_10_14_0_2_um_filter_55_20]PJB82467.1 MAG: hypothetical protein CO089_01330 [Zetaproteobacteria bacterium CG_4_9_
MQHCFRCDVGLKGDMLKPHVLMFAIVLMLGAPLFSQAGDSLSLPPDPGEAGKATLEGIDSDGDGVRDDVQRWIALTYPNSKKTRAALTQDAKAIQQYLLDSADPIKTFNNVLQMDKAIECYFYIDPANAYSLSHNLEAIILDTSIRVRASFQADHSLSGKMVPSRQNKKQSCAFDPDVMPN